MKRFDNLVEKVFKISVDEILKEADYNRLDQKLAKSFLYVQRHTLDNIFSPPSKGNDIDLKLLDQYITDLQKIRKQVK